ncbi:MAG: hypothetical protein D3924_00830 [Candidatus Electrothrix sp. AR4]|nr:hypothetical protein [Candidatus Electrothrix sp. AR4]
MHSVSNFVPCQLLAEFIERCFFRKYFLYLTTKKNGSKEIFPFNPFFFNKILLNQDIFITPQERQC